MRLMLLHARRNAVAYLALFVALGGTGYAAAKLPRNSVGSTQIKHGAVAASDLRKGAVTSSAIRDHSVSAVDLVKGLAPAGPQGERGPGGPAGATGQTGKDGAEGKQGPAGPTEGTSSDAYTIPASETKLDASPFTTTRAGRVLVVKTLAYLQIQCSPVNTWSAWLVVDGVRVPGTLYELVPSSTTLYGVSLTGVTGRLPAGSHDAQVAVDCAGSSVSGLNFPGGQSVTAVVLG